MTPPTEAGVIEAIRTAHATSTPLAICGNASKQGLLRPVQAAETLSTAALSGISLYSPQELILAAGPGTTMADLADAVAAKGQHIISEPPDLSAFYGTTTAPTLGGMVAANLSGVLGLLPGAPAASCGAPRETTSWASPPSTAPANASTPAAAC